MNKLYEKYFDELINLNPSINDYLGIEKYSHLKNLYENTIHPEHIKKSKEFYKKYLKLLNKKEKLNHYDRVLKLSIKINLDYYNYNFDYLPLDHENNPIAFFCESSSGKLYYTFKTHSDYYKFIEKTKYFSEYILTCIENMKLGIKKKIVLPKILAKKLLEQIKDIIKKKPYKNDNVPKNLKVDFNKEIENILDKTLKKLVKFLTETYIPKCRNTYGLSSLPNGDKMYLYSAKKFICLKNISIEKIHNYGLKEVKRIYQEMIKIKNKMSFKGNLQDFNKDFLSRKDLKFKNRNDALNSYRKFLKEIDETVMKTQFKTKISHPCKITSVPKFNEEYATSAYYLPGDILGKRKGTFYLNLGKLESLSRAEIECLSLHEAHPGHHFQLTTMLDKNLPLFIKCESGNETSFEEGWALYCETLGEYKTNDSYYGKLNYEMLRALRLVVDTGIHHYKWSPEKCIKFMMKYCFDDRKVIESEVYRYMAYPGQALSYKMGEKYFLDLKNKYVKPKKLDIKEFHHRCLRFGSMPLQLLEESFNL